ncbi:MAG: UDP-N-acetylmuramoyl-tripeptide--D-alanyl-D-alanine ligase [Bergeyella sp.]|nr:UDP-N-acetylmuramoyl-tripeptide--D-alanyl-D-alanine ligase [Bergeyella sp.]
MITVRDFYEEFNTYSQVVIDSRKVNSGDIFFAFSGENYNAATRAEEALEKGAMAVIVEDKSFENKSKNIFYVSSTLDFLQGMAAEHRRHIKVPVIGLTGSNGKTTTKELISAVLAKKFRVRHTQGNLNNHIGVPLTVLSIESADEIAVIEMGANHLGEIGLLCNISQPDFGYITNFGKAHLEGFGSMEGVIEGKSEMYLYLMNSQKYVWVNDQDDIQQEKTKGYKKKISFGKENSDYFFESFSSIHRIGISLEGGVQALSRLTGAYNFAHLSIAAAMGLYFGIDKKKIKAAIENYTPTNMRSQIIRKENKTILLDTYNANPSSMEASLKNFADFRGRKTIILGDMLELGIDSEKEHKAIFKMASKMGFDSIITVGEHFGKLNKYRAFGGTASLINYLRENPIISENVLIKGSRGIALEEIIDFV